MTPSTLFLILSLLCQLCLSARLFSLSPLLNACAVSDSRRGRREPKESSSREPILVEFDEYGNIPAIKHVYAAIDKAARTVVVLSSDRLRLICGYRHSNNDDIMKYSNLRLANGNIKIINKIMYNGACNKIIVITGFEGDCRYIIKHIKRAFADYVSSFNEPPTALYLANDCAILLQENSLGGARPLATHIFLAERTAVDADSGSGGGSNGGDRKSASATVSGDKLQGYYSLYEVTAVGQVQEVAGGVAGSCMVEGRELLAKRVEEAHDFLLSNNSQSLAEIVKEVLMIPFSEDRYTSRPGDTSDNENTTTTGPAGRNVSVFIEVF